MKPSRPSRTFRISRALALALAASVAGSLAAQDLAPPPNDWVPFDPARGAIAEVGTDGPFFRAEGGTFGVRGEGKSSAYWRAANVALVPGGSYLFRFGASGRGSGLIVSGPEVVNRDFVPPGNETTFSFAFRLPDFERPTVLRLGQWELAGEVRFRDPELVPVRVVHETMGPTAQAPVLLGEGERLESGLYVDAHAPEWRGSTIHRTLAVQRAGFNSNRWVFGPSDEIRYRHALPFDLRSARVTIRVNHRTSGTLRVEASADGERWSPVLEASKVGEASGIIPASLFPSRDIQVRLGIAGAEGSIQVDAYRFESVVDYAGPTWLGASHILEESVRTKDLEVDWRPALAGVDRVEVRGRLPESAIEATLTVDGEPRGKTMLAGQPAAGASSVSGSLSAGRLLAGSHVAELCLRSGSRLLHRARHEFQVSAIEESGYGEALASRTEGLSLWWCDGARRVGKSAKPSGSSKKAGCVKIEGARGEFEPAQLVVRAANPGVSIEAVRVGDLRSGGRIIPSSAVTILEVATVRVESPSDAAGGPGDYPDPLPPPRFPLLLRSGENQALWVLVRVPADAKAGLWSGTISLETSLGKEEIPLELRVFDFALPRSTRLRGGFGFDPGILRAYHRLRSDEELRLVYARYLESFAEHRVTPYSFYALDPIRLGWKGEGAARRPAVDFSAFDRAASHWLDERGLNSFMLPVEGLGGGTFHERVPGRFGGFEVGSEKYEELLGDYLGQIREHLAAKGWLSKAYVYWFDEPDPKDYPFVVDVMQRLRRHAPGLARMLTEQPEPALLGHVDIWCGLTPEWTRESVGARRKAGEEVWWYVCTGPKAPYIGLFTEHPALEMRLWAWQSWQYQVEGLLVWQTNYWTSDTAFPGGLQDPWKDPMSYTSGYGTPSGTKLPWGNGDGRFFYPPRIDPAEKGPPILDGPIVSIRWENLRDGIEDHEYLSILRDSIESGRATLDPKILSEAEALLVVPDAISRDLTHFTTDPSLVLAHRRRVAEAIEKLAVK